MCVPPTSQGWSGWTTEQRVAKLRGAISKKACSAIGNKQIAMMGEEGERKFGDFNELMQKGGVMSNLNMGPEQAKKVLQQPMQTGMVVTTSTRMMT